MEPRQEHEPRGKFDQQEALEELERFGRDIQRYRAQREALGDEFEHFIQSFKTPAAVPPSAAVSVPAPAPPPLASAPSLSAPGSAPSMPAPAPAAPPVAVPAPPPTAAPAPLATAVPASPPTATPPIEPARSPIAVDAPVADETMPVFENPATEVSPPAMAAPPDLVAVAAPRARAKNTPIAAIAAGAGILLGGGLLAAFLWNRGPGPTTEPGANADVPAATAPATADTPAATPAPAPAAPPPAAPAAASSGDSEIVAERQVWMRVTVDGARVVEREVPAGTRIPLKAEKTIVIRTGNAGAVRLSIRGQAGALLGREGEVVTRSFTVPPPSAPGVR